MAVDVDAGAERAARETSRETITCTNPATGEVIDEIPAATAEEVDRAADRAGEAQDHWARLPARERAEYLLDAREAILDHRNELRDLLVEEAGQIDGLAEILLTLDTLGYYASEGPEMLADEKLDLHLLKNKRVVVQHAPAGLVVNISPWNFPLDLSINPIIPALMAGNAAIIKPSEWTPLTAMRTVEIMNRAGLPEGLLQVVPGYGQAGAQLVDHADAVSFTGSVSTGRQVAVGAAENLVSCTLELGGKDPAIVLDDADVERAANGVTWGAFFNSGQCCMSVERAFVHEAVYDEFVERVVRTTRDLRQGDPSARQVDVGAMTFPDQIETVETHVQDAIASGAEVLVGGERPDLKGDFFEPTVLVDVEPSMTIMTEETFGPVLPIMKVPSAAEAIRLSNESRFGLNSSIWSQNKPRARRLARQIDAGNVCINDVIASYTVVEAPYGGVKDSGLGRRKGRWEIDDYTEPKTIMEDLIGLSREPFWYPYSEKVASVVNSALEPLFRQGLTGKIRGLFSSNDD
ncbi:MAG: aldehyde dehydrogenase family protein [Bradymonadaceae bacterium]